MAFKAQGLVTRPRGVTVAGGAPAVDATYDDTDAAATGEVGNYFLPAQAQLPKGSTISAVWATGGTPVHKTYVVTVSNATTLTIVLQATTAG